MKNPLTAVIIVKVRSVTIIIGKVNVRLKRVYLVTLLRQKRRRLFLLRVSLKTISLAIHLQLQSLVCLGLLLRWVVDLLLSLLAASLCLRRQLKQSAHLMMRIQPSLDVPVFLEPVLSLHLCEPPCLLV